MSKSNKKILLRAIEQFSYEIYGPNYATIDHIIPKSKGGSEALGVDRQNNADNTTALYPSA